MRHLTVTFLLLGSAACPWFLCSFLFWDTNYEESLGLSCFCLWGEPNNTRLEISHTKERPWRHNISLSAFTVINLQSPALRCTCLIVVSKVLTCSVIIEKYFSSLSSLFQRFTTILRSSKYKHLYILTII